MELSEAEKRMLYQMEGGGVEEVLHDLRSSAAYAPRPEQRETARSVIRKLQEATREESWRVIMDIRRHYRIPGGAKTMGEMIAEARQRSGEEYLQGHDIMALERFMEGTRHMIVFDVISAECSVGDIGDRMRLFLTDEGYEKFRREQTEGLVKIRKHAGHEADEAGDDTGQEEPCGDADRYKEGDRGNRLFP